MQQGKGSRDNRCHLLLLEPQSFKAVTVQRRFRPWALFQASVVISTVEMLDFWTYFVTFVDKKLYRSNDFFEILIRTLL